MTRKNQQPVVCPQCSKHFTIPLSKVTMPGKRYCSSACYWESMAGKPFTPITRETIICSYCQKAVERSQSKISRSPIQFCSIQCHGLYRRQHPVDQSAGTERLRGRIDLESAPVSADRLRDLYITQQLSVEAVAEALSCGRGVALRLLNDNDIPIRPRKERSYTAASHPNDGRHTSSRVLSRERSAAWRLANPEQVSKNGVRAYLIVKAKRGPTNIETRMKTALAALDIPFETECVVDERFVCDFGFRAQRLMVECDGTHWHKTPQIHERDRLRDAALVALGYTVLHFTDTAINGDIDGCVRVITSHLTHSAS